MTSFFKTINRLFLFRWETFAAFVIIIFAVLVVRLLFPFANNVIKDAVVVSKNISFMNKADSIAARVISTRNEGNSLEETINNSKNVGLFNEGTLPGAIYDLAAKSGIKASKVEISVSSGAMEGRQIPVRFTGQGDYASCGRFIDGVEYLNNVTRIRELSMKSSGRVTGTVELFLDFAVMGE
jgi:hypothetical protein